MKLVPLAHALCFTAALLLAGCMDSPAPPGHVSAPVSEAPLAPVSGAALVGEVIDRDGDGQADTWLEVDESGEMTQGRDTDGDGAPDVFEVVETLKEPPPGFPVGLGSLKPQ